MTEPTTIGPSSFDLFDNERCWRPSRRDIIEAVRACQPATVAEVTDVACPPSERWRLRGTVRNRLYELETIGAVVCDDERPMRFRLDVTDETEGDQP